MNRIQMDITNLKKNIIKSGGQSYSNYIYTFIINGESELLPYQIETNQAFNNYLNGQGDILMKFKNALALNENYITIMNMCVSSLAQRNFEDLDQLINKALYYSKGQTHHMIFLVEYHLLLNDHDSALKQLIELFISKEELDEVQDLLKVIFKNKLYSKANLEIFVQDIDILEQLIKLNKQCFIQYQSYISQNSTLKTLELIENVFKQQLSKAQSIISNQQSFNQEEINNTLSQQTQKTEQLSFISEKQDVDCNFNNIEQLDFSFIDIVQNNPNLFSFKFRIPYIIGSYDIKKMSKLQSKIAEGGFGEVYLAKHLITNEMHAIKVIKQQEDQNVNLILQETIIQDKIQKLNPQLFLNLKPLVYLKKEYLLVDIYIPLELGQFSLYEYILEHQISQCEYNQFYNLFIDFIITLHTNKYAHRDIKPQNILYVKEMGWKLADFGESIKYDNALDIYKIKGTFAFLPLDLRQSSKKIQQIKQNLLYNDVYAVVCTLLMTKNPNFSSKDLANYMDQNQLEYQLQQLLDNFDNLQLLSEMKISNMQSIQPQLTKQYIYDQEINLDCYEKLKFNIGNNQQLDNDTIQKLDEQLHLNQFFCLIISYYFPFQIDQFKNMKIFNFFRPYLAEYLFFLNINDQDQYYQIILYFLQIKHEDIAIRLCDQAFNIKQNLTFYLLKISALISQEKQEQAKQELELTYRYFLSTQSYSLQELTLFYALYFKLHNEIPKIKIDKEIQDELFAYFDQTPNKYKMLLTTISPIKQQIAHHKQHLNLRLDVLFEFIKQDPYMINMNILVENIKQFGNQFIVDGELQNCQELISLFKENLIFWNHTYISKIHLIAIGINYLLTYFGKYQIALSIGEYFHKILRNIGSCQRILYHYEHLISTQYIVIQQFPQIEGPFIHIDFQNFLEEIKYLPFVEKVYLHIKLLFISYQFDKQFKVLSQEFYQGFVYTMNQLLDQLLYFVYQKDTPNVIKKKWLQFLINMIRKITLASNQSLINLLQVVKKIFQVVCAIYQNQMIYNFHYNFALDKTKQSRINLAIVKLYLNDKVNLQFLEKIIFKNLVHIFMSPIKAINILKLYGLKIEQPLIVSVKSNFNDDLRQFLFCRQEIRKMKVTPKFFQKVDQINMKQQYLNL